MPTFRFTIALPPHDEYAALFRDVTDQMTRYLGLERTDAERAGAALGQLVAERLQRAGDTRQPVTVSFERPAAEGPVTVELTGPRAPGDAALASGAGLQVEGDAEHAPLRLSWTVGD